MDSRSARRIWRVQQLEPGRSLSGLDDCLNELQLDGISFYTNIAATSIDELVDLVFPLIMNSFSGLATVVGTRYFERREYHEESRMVYRGLRLPADSPQSNSEVNLVKRKP